MPIPVLVGVAIAVGGALAGGGGVAVYKGAKHKKEVASLQDKIHSLQEELEESRKREKELLVKINKIEKERARLIAQIRSRQECIERYRQEREQLAERLSRNDTRFRRVIAAITFRLKKLEEENLMLREKLAEAESRLGRETSSLDKMNKKVVYLKADEDRVNSQLAETRQAMNQIKKEMKALEG